MIVCESCARNSPPARRHRAISTKMAGRRLKIQELLLVRIHISTYNWATQPSPSRRQTTPPSTRHRHDARPRPSHVRHRYGRAAAAGRIARGERRLPRLCQSVVRHAARAARARRQHALRAQNRAVEAPDPARRRRVPRSTARVEALQLRSLCGKAQIEAVHSCATHMKLLQQRCSAL